MLQRVGNCSDRHTNWRTTAWESRSVTVHFLITCALWPGAQLPRRRSINENKNTLPQLTPHWSLNMAWAGASAQTPQPAWSQSCSPSMQRNRLGSSNARCSFYGALPLFSFYLSAFDITAELHFVRSWMKRRTWLRDKYPTHNTAVRKQRM